MEMWITSTLYANVVKHYSNCIKILLSCPFGEQAAKKWAANLHSSESTKQSQASRVLTGWSRNYVLVPTFPDLAQWITSESTAYLGKRPNSGGGGRCQRKHKEPRRQSRNAARTKHAVAPAALGLLCLEVSGGVCPSAARSFTCIYTFPQQIPPLAPSFGL